MDKLKWHCTLLLVFAFVFSVNIVSARIEMCNEIDNTKGILPTMHIGNFVWHDINGDGIQDDDEPGISGVPVILFNDQNDQVDSTTTNSSGNYLFLDVPPGAYFIVFEDPDGYSSTFPNETDDENDSDITNSVINSGGSTTDVFVVTSGSPDLSFDAGYYLCVPIGELVWYDYNGNDIVDDIENGINGLTVNLYRLVAGSFELYATEITDLKPGTPSDDGYYKFCAPPGTYYVEVQIPPVGLIVATPNQVNSLPLGNTNEPTNDSDLTNNFGQNTTASFSVLSGDQICTIGAGFYPMASICGVVWEDINKNGIRNDDEPKVSGVLVEAFELTGVKVGEAITNVSGVYEIDNLKKNDHFLVFTPPIGYEFTIANIGGDDKDSDVTDAFGENTTNALMLEAGSKANNIDAGTSGLILSVEWASISAEWRGNAAQLRWSTVSEINNDYYEIERRHKSEAEFSFLDRLTAAGNSSSNRNYLFDDKGEFESGTYYYRIKQVDFNGKSSYSSTVSISIYDKERQINLYPNPSIGVSNLTLVLSDTKEVVVSVYDDSGKLVRKIPVVQNNLTGIDTEIRIDNLSKGIYTVQIENDELKEIKRLIVVK